MNKFAYFLDPSSIGTLGGFWGWYKKCAVQSVRWLNIPIHPLRFRDIPFSRQMASVAPVVRPAT